MPTAGGAVSLNGENAIEMKNCQVMRNLALLGGAIAESEGNSHFKYLNNTQFLQNAAVLDGGVLFLTSPNWVIFNSTFYNNTAYDSGGVLYTETSPSISLQSSTFEHNTAFVDGGCFALRGLAFCVDVFCVYVVLATFIQIYIYIYMECVCVNVCIDMECSANGKTRVAERGNLVATIDSLFFLLLLFICLFILFQVIYKKHKKHKKRLQFFKE
ncbi:adhesin-like protein [Reticulomyxa filosa]|uniref:Adhesin-like protein n=1 Tax=Reticulomyxa filosa TaxID=46433 RepID=X6N5D4_RETFI|nr:adhesin-like protein [Reticulomyxa filosa]|eukprot:ETO21236.1 adhesin-like protein [Reticulomyxa filosa]